MCRGRPGRAALLLAALAAIPVAARAQAADAFRSRLEARIAASGAAAVGVYFRDLARPDSLLIRAELRFHAASTMKIPVMIQVFRDADQGRLRLDDSIPVVNTFRSLADSSTYTLDPGDDSDSTLYRRAGARATIGELVELMITVSSNLATNILIDHVGAARAQSTARELGADSIAVLRGVEDGKAYRAGINNTTTARDLGVLLAAIAEGRAASPPSCSRMLGILERQHFNEGIPAGLPAGTPVAHKTGWFTGTHHDAALVFPPGHRGYVLVVLTRGIADQGESARLMADLSRMVFERAGEP